MLIARRADIQPSEITPEDVYLQRRRFLGHAAALCAAAAAPAAPAAADDIRVALLPGEKPNSWDEITSYNNFYEYSPDKHAVAALAQNLAPHPWTISIEGEVARPRTLDIEQLLREFRPRERIYRLRCVEGWSMVIPWSGIPLAEILKRVEPLGSAKFVSFETLHRPSEMPG